MPLQATSGAASYDAFGGGVPVEPVYIEQIFSTYLYTGNAGTQTITNGIDLSTKGGLTWFKNRTSAANHLLYDTSSDSYGFSNLTAAFNANAGLFVPSTTGISFTVNATTVNTSGNNYASWTFRKQPKFFDVVTYTGNGAVRTLAHNLGSVPGCVLIKCTSLGGTDWMVFHRSASTGYLYLNSTSALMTAGAATFFGNGTSVVAPDATSIYLGSGDGQINQTSATYVAYLFAHNAGGFGLSGTDNVVSCGSYTGNASTTGPVINLGYEPQWVMIKSSSAGSAENWYVFDSMRGMVNGSGNDAYLIPNLTNAEAATILISPTATGFTLEDGNTPVNRSSTTYIYIAIRRGPMKVPTSGTKVFAPVVSSVSDGTQITSGFPVDMQMFRYRAGTVSTFVVDRLRGVGTTTTAIANPQIRTNLTTAETNTTGVAVNWNNTGFAMPTGFGGVSDIFWNFQRAPSFFDEVCYTGGITSNPSHNLGVTPEMYIVKCRSSGTSDRGWYVYHTGYDTANNYILMNSSAGLASLSGVWSSGPTSTTFGVTNGYAVNDSGQTYVTYLFATCAGVSKVTSFTGNGSSQTINCGFTAGSRFVMIKRTDSTGDWYVWDSARGIVSGNDPHLSLNSTAAEVTTDDTIDTDSTGFIVNQVSATNCNVNGASYIVLAIA